MSGFELLHELAGDGECFVEGNVEEPEGGV